jgi:ABC-2 type transport system ATP-binding protein
MTAAIEVEDLVKRYPRGRANAVDGVSFAVRRGETFGLLGPNGAGKTTAIGILTTRVLPTSGRAAVAGIDVVADPIAAKQRIGVVPQTSNLDRSLRVREILTFHAAYHGVSRRERQARADGLLEELGLAARGKDKLDWFSGGLQQRVMLGRALMHEPDVLFLDEPTNNLDPQSRLFLWDRIRALHERGVTVVLTTHDMEEADRLCDRIAIMDHGRILALDTPKALKQSIGADTIVTIKTTGDAGRLAGLLKNDVEGVARTRTADDKIELHMQGADRLVPRIVLAAEREGFDLSDVSIAEPTLETVFISLTGKDLRD